MEQIADTAAVVQQNITDNVEATTLWSVWSIVAISVTLFAVLALVLYIFRDKKKRRVKDKIMNETADVGFNTLNEWKKAERLYNELKRICHPDLFHDERNEIANEIFQRLTENKYRYQELLKIRDEAIEKLGIKVTDNKY